MSCRGPALFCSDRSAAYRVKDLERCKTVDMENLIHYGSCEVQNIHGAIFLPSFAGGLEAAKPIQGWSSVVLPGKLFFIEPHLPEPRRL